VTPAAATDIATSVVPQLNAITTNTTTTRLTRTRRTLIVTQRLSDAWEPRANHGTNEMGASVSTRRPGRPSVRGNRGAGSNEDLQATALAFAWRNR
jgi:hypothetical protein